MTYNTPYCDTFWGSHGCDLPPGHDGPHVCGALDGSLGLCSRAEGQAGEDGTVRFWNGDDWDDEPMTGWRLFSNHGPEDTR